MNNLLQLRFPCLLSECSQRKVSVSEFAVAIKELAIYVADCSITVNSSIYGELFNKSLGLKKVSKKENYNN
ncbi:hypothetical protein [Parabacteroides johnsonii]|uniref:hypothetical protein n=1 Tax=Parabacteroides johnsonii TaxID=387661 RepID=UPI00265D3E61|nr:hypothetical protein [Parabacteroides johnsonii]